MSTFGQFRVQVFGASTDTVEDNRLFAQRQGYPFPLLCDTKGEAARAYGVLNPDTGRARRWTFVIDDQGVIRAIDRQVNNPTHGKDLARLLEQVGIARK